MNALLYNFIMPTYNPQDTEALLVCTACGTQFPTPDSSALKTCFICDDPRQYTPPSGQAFSTLAEIRTKHKNVFQPFETDARFVSITTTPKLAIGQRAILVRTPAGNILWDCLTLLDEDTIAEIKKLGGLRGVCFNSCALFPRSGRSGVSRSCSLQGHAAVRLCPKTKIIDICH